MDQYYEFIQECIDFDQYIFSQNYILEYQTVYEETDNKKSGRLQTLFDKLRKFIQNIISRLQKLFGKLSEFIKSKTKSNNSILERIKNKFRSGKASNNPYNSYNGKTDYRPRSTEHDDVLEYSIDKKSQDDITVLYRSPDALFKYLENAGVLVDSVVEEQRRKYYKIRGLLYGGRQLSREELKTVKDLMDEFKSFYQRYEDRIRKHSVSFLKSRGISVNKDDSLESMAQNYTNIKCADIVKVHGNYSNIVDQMIKINSNNTGIMNKALSQGKNLVKQLQDFQKEMEPFSHVSREDEMAMRMAFGVTLSSVITQGITPTQSILSYAATLKGHMAKVNSMYTNILCRLISELESSM